VQYLSEIYHRTRAKSIVELAIAPVLYIINALPSQAHSKNTLGVALVENGQQGHLSDIFIF
jgi:hypothetical protein